MEQIINYILLTVAPRIGNSLGEKIFIGVLTSITLSIIFIIVNNKKEKKLRKCEEQIQVDNQNKEYNETLKLIAAESNLRYKIVISQLLSELTEACNPKNYLEPYQPEKVDIANNLYQNLISLDIKRNIYNHLLDIWANAEIKLNIRLSSDIIYHTLSEIYNPHKFVDNGFDANKLKCTNQASQYINENKNNRRILEQFAKAIGIIEFDDNCNQLIPVSCNGELCFGEVVFVYGKYPLLFYNIVDECYILYQINDNVKYQGCIELHEYIEVDSVGRNYIKIPFCECEIIAN